MSSSHRIRTGEPSIKHHPYYAEAATAVLLGFGFLGPELIAAVAIAVHGWFNWEKAATSSAKTHSRPLPLSRPANQDGPQHIHTALATPQDASSHLSLQLELEFTEQEPEEPNELAELLQPKPEVSIPAAQLSTSQVLTAIPFPDFGQDFAVPERTESNETL